MAIWRSDGAVTLFSMIDQISQRLLVHSRVHGNSAKTEQVKTVGQLFPRIRSRSPQMIH